MDKYQLIKQAVYEANLQLKKSGLVLFTWGNVSQRDEKLKIIAIKPSGVAYESLKPEDIVIVDEQGQVIDGNLNPSVDLATHLEIYRQNPSINGIAHTHSTYATSWAQKGRSIPLYGTTHADYFATDIPCAPHLTSEQMDEYEKNTGVVINRNINQSNPLETPGIIISGHGVFAWGKDGAQAVYHAIVLEEIAKMAYLTETLPGENKKLPDHIKMIHYMRKHGPKARYGQKK